MGIYLSYYDEKLFPSDTLLFLWNKLIDNGFGEEVFNTEKPPSLNEFIRAMFPVPHRVMCLPYQSEDGAFHSLEQIIGVMTLADMIPGHKAVCEIWIDKALHGTGLALEAGRQAITAAFSPPFSLQVLIGTVNEQNTRTIGFARKLGFKELGTIPSWFLHNGELSGCRLVYCTAEMAREALK